MLGGICDPKRPDNAWKFHLGNFQGMVIWYPKRFRLESA